jgi:hypothetical protein
MRVAITDGGVIFDRNTLQTRSPRMSALNRNVIYGDASEQKGPTINSLLIDDQGWHLWGRYRHLWRRHVIATLRPTPAPERARQRQIRGGQLLRHGRSRI